MRTILTVLTTLMGGARSEGWRMSRRRLRTADPSGPKRYEALRRFRPKKPDACARLRTSSPTIGSLKPATCKIL
jgi:hypothetical protein